MYNNGFEFFQDLIDTYGKKQALQIANKYLDMQIKNTDKEEYIFCCELYRATQQTDKNN